MSLETGLKAALIANGTVDGIVSGRVFSEVVPQGQDLPALVFERVAIVAEQDLAGPGGLEVATMRVHCWSTSASAVWTLAAAVRSLLDIGPSADLGGFTIQQIYLEDEFPQSVFEGDRRDYRVIQQYVIRY